MTFDELDKLDMTQLSAATLRQLITEYYTLLSDTELGQIQSLDYKPLEDMEKEARAYIRRLEAALKKISRDPAPVFNMI